MPGTGDTTVTSQSFDSVHGSKQLDHVETLQAQAGPPNSQVGITLTEMGVTLVFYENNAI